MKLITVVVLIITIGVMITTCAIGKPLWDFYEFKGVNHPLIEDVTKAKINEAIAIQKIAEEGIILKVIILEDNRKE